VIDEGHATRHAGAEIVTDGAENGDRAACHILAGIGAGAFDDRGCAGIADGEAFAGEARGIEFAARCPIEAGVADDGAGLFSWRRAQCDEAATETFANVIVCVARDIERNALHEPRAETLPARAAQLHRELPFRQRILADAARDVRRRARTDGALRVANIEDELLLLATLEKAWRLIDEFVVKRLRRFVAAKLGAIAWVRAIDAYEQRIEIE